MNINFTHPEYLVLLFAVPAAIFIHFFSLKSGRQKAVKFANFEAIARIKGIDVYSKNIAIPALTCCMIFLMVFAISGMQITREVDTSSFSFVITIDSSRSMEAQDVAPSRMEAAKEVADYFLQSLPEGTEAGVISFSGNALIEQRITEDRGLARGAVSGINITGIGGTDVYEALITGSNLFSEDDAKAIILLSDGQINVGGLEEAIDYAKKNEITVHTIALGTKEGGQTSYGLSRVDEDSLKAISYNTGGQFFTAEDREGLKNSFDGILAIKKRNVQASASRLLIILALIIAFAEYALISFNLRSFP